MKEDIQLNNITRSLQYDYLEFDKEYFLIIKGGLFPLGYHISIFCDHLIENMSYNTYLKRFYGHSSIVYKLDHPNLEKNKMYVMMRLSINVSKIRI